jgi:hypothetical protein
MCDTGLIEDVRYFVMVCPAYAPKRAKLLDRVHTLVNSAGAPAFHDMSEEEKFHRAILVQVLECKGASMAVTGYTIMSREPRGLWYII